ncbi:Thiol-disulfide isomerase or thioredoxin [Micromonospora pallida]|uniref:Thiol-disulfide isomerase or thioredoxin n=1 Tax=Micromonospora pallida TaxID=145854 RepID=A0A1C6TE11_9ACTN|nr:TlpA disulfide reductase family protein [Micromonospora pallida]SCL39939.1 Thiol-disulfide isomerase or thioredoxin [Micromonospora pallida]
MNRRVAAALLAPLLALTGCTTGETDQTSASPAATGDSPFADCATLTAPPSAPPAGSSPAPSGPAAGPSSPAAVPGTSSDPAAALVPSSGRAAGSSPAASSGAGRELPDLSFVCLTGGTEVSLKAVRGPAVINLWASWCGPCRKELPAFQRLHERAAGQVHVIGVNTSDDRSRAISIGEDFGVTFPTLVDTDQQLQRALPPIAMPKTILVDAQGRIRHQDVSGALDDARLADLVRRHLDLDLPA